VDQRLLSISFSSITSRFDFLFVTQFQVRSLLATPLAFVTHIHVAEFLVGLTCLYAPETHKDVIQNASNPVIVKVIRVHILLQFSDSVISLRNLADRRTRNHIQSLLNMLPPIQYTAGMVVWEVETRSSVNPYKQN
jgi:hypothetical protein